MGCSSAIHSAKTTALTVTGQQAVKQQTKNSQQAGVEGHESIYWVGLLGL
jgi:hypothetical protein